MIFDFDNRAILTTHNPETFLNVRWEPSDPSLHLSLAVDASIVEEKFYINGIDAYEYIEPSTGLHLFLNEDGNEPSIGSFHIYTRDLYDWDYNVRLSEFFQGTVQLIEDWPEEDGMDVFTTTDNIINLMQTNSPGFVATNTFPIEEKEIYKIIINVSKNSPGSQIPIPVVEEDGNINTPYTIPVEGTYEFIHYTTGSTGMRVLYVVEATPIDIDGYVEVYKIGNVYDDITISNRPYIVNEGEINTYESSNTLIDDETSYMLLRTNPKFSGNIKIVADSKNRFFLDTFKVSDILNNKKYRRQRISGESVFSGDVRRIFSSLPRGEVFRVDEDDTLNVSLPRTELHKQYNLTYSYGARMINDSLYSEPHALLAPLWINNTLPDYFAVFKVGNTYNPETLIDPCTGEPGDIESIPLKYFKEGEIVKSWGMKEETPLGNYLQNHLDELSKVRSPLFLSLSDPDQKDPDPNTWYGVAVDKGIITGRSETPYQFDRQQTFTDTNAFLSLGFERLNLLCPNLLNMEFLFHDDNTDLYSMNRYYGLYLSENELFKISYYAESPEDDIEILSLDGKNINSFFNSTIFEGASGQIIQNYEDRFFTINDIQDIKRFRNRNQINGNDKDFISKWINVPGEQIFSATVNDVSINKFMTIKINEKLEQGEHLRIIDKTSDRIWEVYGTKCDGVLLPGESWTYATVYESESGDYPTVYRTVFCVEGTIEQQIQAIKKAFEVFNDYDNTPFMVISSSDDTVSFEIISRIEHDYYFQRLTANTVNDPNEPGSPFNSAAGYTNINFFGVFNPSVGDFTRLDADDEYGPINFEIYGDRMSIQVPFKDSNDKFLYSLDKSYGDFFQKYMLYMGEDSWYRLINKFNINDYEFRYVYDPTDSDKILIETNTILLPLGEKWNARKPYPLSVSLMGVNPVKDFDFTVYDSSIGFESEYFYDRYDDSSTYYHVIEENNEFILESRGSYKIIDGEGEIYIGLESSIYDASINNQFTFNTFDDNARIVTNTKTTITYNVIDGSKNYETYNTGVSEENIDDYYLNPGRLKYGLTVPYITKWVGLGKDVRGNELRINFDASLYDSSCNFIPYNDCFSNEISYPSFKYLDTGDRAWESYVYFDINDVIKYEEDGTEKHTTFKELMFLNPYIDIFSKLMYSSKNSASTATRSSIVYYNSYKNTIDTIINGLNLSFRLDEGAQGLFSIRNWDRYRISFISTSSKNRDNIYPIEVFINENTETILIVWYQGTETLNYNKRFSSFFGGKSLLEYNNAPTAFQGFKDGEPQWSFVKAPMVVNTADATTPTIRNIYDKESDYGPNRVTPYLQFNWNFTSEIKSIFNAYTFNEVISEEFGFNDQYNTFEGYVDYDYNSSPPSFGARVLNHGYIYGKNENFYDHITTEIEHLEHIFINNNINYYIFRNDDVYDDTYFSVAPVIPKINPPRLYKGIYTYNGWYKPKFKNIINFRSNEHINIVNILETDFTFSNTKFSGYNNIEQFWYRKITDEVTSQDVEDRNAINFLEEFNPFLSQWDNQYYTLYTETSSEKVNGYNASVEQPSFFGSKLIKLPIPLELTNWNVTKTNFREGPNTHVLEFNITKNIIDIFKNNSSFFNNWTSLGVTIDIIDNYINDTILEYYKINNNSIETKVWTKPYDGRRIAFSKDDSFELSRANLDGNIIVENDEYLYRARVPAIPDLTYYVEFTIS